MTYRANDLRSNWIECFFEYYSANIERISDRETQREVNIEERFYKTFKLSVFSEIYAGQFQF